MKDNQHEQLFTELTSSEGATISGGTRVNLKYFSVSDTQEWPRDEVYLTVDGNKIWSKDGVGVGVHRIDKTFNISGSYDIVRLFEDDAWPSQDESLGRKTIFASDRGYDLSAPFTQNGANYTLYYDVLA